MFRLARTLTTATAHADLTSYALNLQSSLPLISRFDIYKDELTLHVHRSHIVPTLSFLKLNAATRFEVCVDVCGADYPDREERYLGVD